MSKVAITINGAKREVDVDDDMPLVWVLRDTLSMTGTKFGCGVGECGSCTVLEEDVAQCGYGQPGMILTACSLLREHANPTDEEIDRAMSDSVCRCGTYPRMRKAIRRAAALMQEKKS